MKDPWTKPKVGVECVRWGVHRAGENDGGKMRTSVIEKNY